jgi:hypothetical protein
MVNVQRPTAAALSIDANKEVSSRGLPILGAAKCCYKILRPFRKVNTRSIWPAYIVLDDELKPFVTKAAHGCSWQTKTLLTVHTERDNLPGVL